MNWYRLSQVDLKIEKEMLPNKCRIYLKDEHREVGKLVLQWWDHDPDNYYLTSFRVAPQHQRNGWGTKMIQEVKDTFRDRPILVNPKPYGNEREVNTPPYMRELMGLQEMYNKLGFEHNGPNFMKYKNNEKDL